MNPPPRPPALGSLCSTFCKDMSFGFSTYSHFCPLGTPVIYIYSRFLNDLLLCYHCLHFIFWILKVKTCFPKSCKFLCHYRVPLGCVNSLYFRAVVLLSMSHLRVPCHHRPALDCSLVSLSLEVVTGRFASCGLFTGQSPPHAPSRVDLWVMGGHNAALCPHRPGTQARRSPPGNLGDIRPPCPIILS